MGAHIRTTRFSLNKSSGFTCPSTSPKRRDSPHSWHSLYGTGGEHPRSLLECIIWNPDHVECALIRNSGPWWNVAAVVIPCITRTVCRHGETEEAEQKNDSQEAVQDWKKGIQLQVLSFPQPEVWPHETSLQWSFSLAATERGEGVKAVWWSVNGCISPLYC